MARAWAYRNTPDLFLRKLAQAWRRRRKRSGYRSLLAEGRFLPPIQSSPGERLFTVAMPVWRVAEAHLRAAIASVLDQSYHNWELIALDDASPEPHVARVLAEAARSDPRIRVLSRRTNAGVALATNEILERARGDYVAFLDHDDLLHNRALEFVGRFLALNPEADWIFTDEDKIDESGRHRDPCLKPGWSRHLLLAFNFVSHLRVVRRAVLERIGGHRPGFDGAQDYDLALRVLAEGGRFAHLPGILYHWRATAGSMAGAAAAKPAANGRALAALLEHVRAFPRGGEATGQVLIANASLFRVRRQAEPGLSYATVVNGASPSALVAAARNRAEEVVVLPPPGGVKPGQLAELLALLQVPGTAAAAGRLVAGRRVAASGWVLREDGTLADPWSGVRVRNPGYLNLALVPGRRLIPPPFGWVAWRSALLEAWDAAADVDETWRLAAGWARLGAEVVTTPDVALPVVDPSFAPPEGALPAGLPVSAAAGLALLARLP